MNKLLLNNRPSDSTAEEFTKVWNNSGYSLGALYKTMVQLRDESAKIKADDFDCPNHYAKLAYEAGLRTAYQKILDMLPATAKP